MCGNRHGIRLVTRQDSSIFMKQMFRKILKESRFLWVAFTLRYGNKWMVQWSIFAKQSRVE